MKKIKIILISLLLIFGLAGCDLNKANENENKNDIDEAITENLAEIINELELPMLDSPTANVILPDYLSYNGKSYSLSYKSNSKYFKVEWDGTRFVGYVERKTYDVAVVLTASIEANNKKASKDFSFTILAKANNDTTNNYLEDIIAKLEINNGIYSLKNDIKLPKYLKTDGAYYKIYYEANNTNLVISEGLDDVSAKIKQTDKDITVILKCKIVKGDIEATKSFNLTILKKDNSNKLDENGVYNDKDNVALYIVTYHKLPKNYHNKDYFYDNYRNWTRENKMSCGGDHFGNREGKLPRDNYYECDIDYNGGGPKNRGRKRIIFSLDTLNVYYTSNHYQSFTKLYDHGVKC